MLISTRDAQYSAADSEDSEQLSQLASERSESRFKSLASLSDKVCSEFSESESPPRVTGIGEPPSDELLSISTPASELSLILLPTSRAAGSLIVSLGRASRTGNVILRLAGASL
jgi:hypothetical protein